MLLSWIWSTESDSVSWISYLILIYVTKDGKKERKNVNDQIKLQQILKVIVMNVAVDSMKCCNIRCDISNRY